MYQINLLYILNLHNDMPYFSDYKMHLPPPQIWEKNGGASYSPNVAYMARWVGGGRGGGFFSPILLL